LRRLKITPELRHRAKEFAQSAVTAQRIVDRFAAEHRWEQHARRPFYSHLEVVATQAELFRRVLRLAGQPESTPLPSSGLAAALIDGRLIAVAPEEYARLRPQYASTRDSWARLLAHEMVHVLHERLVANDYDAMGPKWFFEGLAAFGANQDLGKAASFHSVADALNATKDNSAGSYGRYKAVVAFLLRKISLAELIGRAGEQDFENWIRSLDNPRRIGARRARKSTGRSVAKGGVRRTGGRRA